jgi:hypothetical protein
MPCFGPDEDQGGDAIRRRNHHFEAQDPPTEQPTTDQPFALHQPERLGRPCRDGVPERIERRRMSRAWQKVHLPGPHRAVERKAVGEEKFEPVANGHLRQQISWRMFRRTGRRFADKDMRKRKNREHVPIPKERNVLYSSRKGSRWYRFAVPAHTDSE